MKTMHEIRKLCSAFQIPGDFVTAEPYGSGHINDTFAVAFDQAGSRIRYILQRINTSIFRDPVQLMENIRRVTEHLSSKAGDSRSTLTLVSALDGKTWFCDADGSYWRVYLFIEHAKSYDVLRTGEQAYEAARAFGRFQADLVDLPGRLVETIPDFHNTPKRIADLEEAVRADVCGRVKTAEPEIEFVLSRKGEAETLIRLNREGAIPERITHNDTKLNNVLIDSVTGLGKCVIDLDTVMPGLVHYDFGDMVRTGTSPAAEDERDLSKVTMRFPMFEALLRGYCSSAGAFLNPVEFEYLPFSGKLITLEIGTRFLTDYLSGDTYFKTHRAGHNLDRARTQIALVESIEQQMDRMNALVKEVGNL